MVSLETQSLQLLFNLFPIGEIACMLHIRDSNCAPDSENMHKLIMKSLKITPDIFHTAEAYALKYLKTGSEYIAVMVRWELIFLHHLWYPGHYNCETCIEKIQSNVEQMQAKMGLKAAFLTTDVGRYGSSVFRDFKALLGSDDNYKLAIKYTEQTLEILYGRPISIREYDDTFEEISGVTNPAYISHLQKTISARAHCLLVIGESTYQEHAVELYNELHPEPDKRCYAHVRVC